ncbi:UDP-4-amino-4,6-dideoxy-N-acetyl-beta-L-altrosamine transaminase [Fibrivirga algicola]|uniref:UDP-4-amino-4, 6-dideoxy-N-acetyl-beta-L-altrosamine transaminase n=1 Tax=Fibrivirga algicola TaxID=2950420 RepID=A0ABX0QDE9_9BACT|nr:UDP-4-amino-4,6-dideoxy-N-acetyl-beta-L-altrosamine transaminase [Fibrivirga algicola]NID10017.1 UDP-4-amino-4,6-dideoxy-N-acetyl-beta-L-altrosamine transaminase [Fibrivirga algicola]
MNNPIPYGRQHITDEDIAAVAEVLRGPMLTQGPAIGAFEKAFAEYISAPYAVAVSNGTAALHLCCMALGVTEGTRVITTPITFSASANCVRYCGGEVYFADIDPETVLLDINAVRALVESKPKGFFSGIIPVDFGGYPVDMAAFRALADEHGLWLLEDSCHSPGGSFVDDDGVTHRCGDSSLADLAIFSFHPVKHIACGEGGMITAGTEALYNHLMRLRTHGITNRPGDFTPPYAGEPERGGWYMQLQELGYNYRLTDMQAALGLSQLNRADQMLIRRRAIAARYDAAFADTNVQTIVPPENVGHAYHLYVVQVDDRKGLYDHLRANNIFAQVHYIPVHTMPYYQQQSNQGNTNAPGDHPLAERYYSRCLSLPMYPTLTDEEQQYVIDQVLAFVGQ